MFVSANTHAHAHTHKVNKQNKCNLTFIIGHNKLNASNWPGSCKKKEKKRKILHALLILLNSNYTKKLFEQIQMQAPNTTFSFSLLPLSPFCNLPSSLSAPPLGSRKSSKHDGWRQHLIRCLHCFKNIDFLVLKLSETGRLFRAEVRPPSSTPFSQEEAAQPAIKGGLPRHRNCWKAHCSFRAFCSNSLSPSSPDP